MHRRRNPILAMIAAIAAGWLSFVPLRAYENPPAPPLPTDLAAQRADMLGAIDKALAGQRLVEAKALLDRLEPEPGTGEDDRADLLRAEWLIAVGRPRDAIPLLVSTEEIDGRQCRKLSAGMIALTQLSELDQADRLAAAPAATCIADPLYWRSLARLHLARDRAPAAVSALRRALALVPENNAVAADLGVALIATGDAAEAADLLSKLLASDPGQSEVRMNLDYANGMLGLQPARAASDSDLGWSNRLQFAGLGAQRANHLVLAEALLGQALIERPRHDDRLWHQYVAVAGRHRKGAGL
ncbi:tetratricopeptide repeat protein [Sphingopyxis macrogoltabida]|uniref:Tetratricopeptide repeat protein n=1 Tax=Sphingopyxis macrogoltabida TaxID=33050 RepID=A0AAC9AVY8_SPHMC|nr:tetratricopeptide repeat protein [Sphingopyxis macrogoltabida]ALJ14579.1 hypothetical protein LH19_17040 [Sphingopyxis macrogoltabida]AMU90841.1 hypothetical protein ATM17_17610 [Sphingopyxis macrogoltabida]